MQVTCQWLSTHVSEMKEKSVSWADSNPRYPAILVGRDIHYTVRSPYLICGNFIDKGRSNVINTRDIFLSWHLCVSWLFPDKSG